MNEKNSANASYHFFFLGLNIATIVPKGIKVLMPRIISFFLDVKKNDGRHAYVQC